MNPQDAYTLLTQYMKQVRERSEASAKRYIEENIDLLDADVTEFLNKCPFGCVEEVCQILIDAGIEVSDEAKRLVDSKVLDAVYGSGNIYMHDLGTYYTPQKPTFDPKWVSYDLSIGKDSMWEGDWKVVKGTV